jgi:ankyrin repeat protein
MMLRKYQIAVLVTVATLAALLTSTVIILNRRTQDRYALFNAAEAGDLERVKLLAQQGAPLNKTVATTFGFTPLIVAVFHNNTNIAYYLVNAGADVNLADKSGTTPLMWAIVRGDEALPLVNFLIAHGAKLDAIDKHGATALSYAHSDPPKPQLIDALRTAILEKNRYHK